MSLRLRLALTALVCAAAPALAQAPIQPPNPIVNGGTLMPQSGGQMISMTPKDVEERKTEYVRGQMEALQKGLKLRGEQTALWKTFETQAFATIPNSFKLVHSFCADPTPQDGRGSFGETAKRLDAVIGMMRIRAAEMQQVEASLAALRASFDSTQEKAYGVFSPTLISVLLTVPFGLPDTGLPFSCAAVNGTAKVLNAPTLPSGPAR